MKCSRSKTIRPIKLKSSHHVDLMRSIWCELFSFVCLIVLYLEHAEKLNISHHVDLMRATWCELFSFLCIPVLDFKHFKVLGGLVFCLFTFFSHFMVCFIFLFLYYTDPFKIPSMNFTWEFYQNSRQAKKFKITMKSINIF